MGKTQAKQNQDNSDGSKNLSKNHLLSLGKKGKEGDKLKKSYGQDLHEALHQEDTRPVQFQGHAGI